MGACALLRVVKNAAEGALPLGVPATNARLDPTPNRTGKAGGHSRSGPIAMGTPASCKATASRQNGLTAMAAVHFGRQLGGCRDVPKMNFGTPSCSASSRKRARLPEDGRAYSVLLRFSHNATSCVGAADATNRDALGPESSAPPAARRDRRWRKIWPSPADNETKCGRKRRCRAKTMQPDGGRWYRPEKRA